LFVLYILLGHRIAEKGGRGGVERLAIAMAIAMIVVSPFGLRSALGALLDPRLPYAGVGGRRHLVRYPVHLRSVCHGATIEIDICTSVVFIASDGLRNRDHCSAADIFRFRINRHWRGNHRRGIEANRRGGTK
jgi:hypothetical protein